MRPEGDQGGCRGGRLALYERIRVGGGLKRPCAWKGESRGVRRLGGNVRRESFLRENINSMRVGGRLRLNVMLNLCCRN